METFSLVAFILYSLATAAIVTRLFHQKGPNLVLVLSLGSFAIIAHSLFNAQVFLTPSDVNFNLLNVVSLVSLIITLTVTTIALKYKVNLLLPVVYGFAGLWQLFMIFAPNIDQIPLHADKIFLISHITLALVAYCILTIATLYTFQAAYINHKLKSKNLTAVAHLPPLMQVEQQLFSILALGTLSLFVSLLLGAVFLEGFFSSNTAHKSILSICALLLYCVILWGHYKQGWRGTKVVTLTVVASSILTLSYFGSRFVKEFLLS